jgi:hypothetical protein
MTRTMVITNTTWKNPAGSIVQRDIVMVCRFFGKEV